MNFYLEKMQKIAKLRINITDLINQYGLTSYDPQRNLTLNIYDNNGLIVKLELDLPFKMEDKRKDHPIIQDLRSLDFCVVDHIN